MKTYIGRARNKRRPSVLTEGGKIVVLVILMIIATILAFCI